MKLTKVFGEAFLGLTCRSASLLHNKSLCNVLDLVAKVTAWLRSSHQGGVFKMIESRAFKKPYQEPV